MEQITGSLKGIYRDRLQDRDGNIIFDSGWNNNTIVDGCRVLLAGFMKGQANFMGIQQMAVGKGKPEWDNGDIKTAEPNTFRLEDAYSKTVDNLAFTFLDENKQPVVEPTMRLQITAELGPDFFDDDQAPQPLREFGLFGQVDDKAYMINVIRHPVIYKDTNSTLLRTMHLYF